MDKIVFTNSKQTVARQGTKEELFWKAILLQYGFTRFR